MMNGPIAPGAVDQNIWLYIVDSADGTAETGVTHATAGLALAYVRNGASSVSCTPTSTLTNLNDTHTDLAIKHAGNGVYRFCAQDAAFAAGVRDVMFNGAATGMIIMPICVALNYAQSSDIQSACNSALVALNLDHLAAASVAGGDVVDNSIIAKMVSKSATADWDSFVNTTDALEAIRDKVGDVETDTQDLQDRTPAALVSGRMDVSVGAMAADVVTASAVAANAIDASALAADAVTEIQSGLATATTAAAIKTVTDQFTFQVSGKVDANITHVNEVQVTGDGDATPWGPV